ncbi:MAG TPA: cellulase family glycosylhydrolase [Bryobacteraceae bacterium]|nr:cellulase family glycosylhydrolase [Bryobacteraceae bacterium]
MSTRREFLAAAAALPIAGAASAERFVRVSRRDPRYLELSDGSPYIPIGLNMISPPRAASGADDLGGIEEWLDALSSFGGNYIRVWVSNPFWDVEHATSGAYDEEKARRTDRLLDLCRRYGIRVKLTLEHFRSIGDGRQKWADKPLHNRANGGPATSIADFFDGAASREQFRKKIAWFGRRYGSRPEVYGWELWNEINAVRGGDYMAWTEAMLPELRRAFPKNLAMQSLGSFDTAGVRDLYRRHSRMPGNDLAQVHRYLDLGADLDICKGAVDVLAADAVRELRGYDAGRPVILAESGAVEPKHSGPFKLYAADRAGIILHDILFAPFFAGAAGTGQIWHWDSYVAANKLWMHFGRFAAAVRGVDPVAERFEAVMIPHERLRVYALKGRRTLLAWCRDARNTWETELRDGDSPERLDGIEIPIDRTGGVSVYDPWTGEWSKAQRSAGRVRLPAFQRSAVIRVE